MTRATGASGGPEVLEGGHRAAEDGPRTGKERPRAARDGLRVRTGTGWPEPPAGKRMSGTGAGMLADPWGASAASSALAGTASAAADPDEVTVQLDGPAPRADSGGRGGSGAGQEGSDGPVFVDESGRRSRRYRRIGMAVGIACAVYAVVIVVTLLSGSSDAPWLPVPGQKDDAPAGKVDTSPLPAESGRPSGAGGSVAPGNIPTASDGTTPSPGVRVSATAGASVKPGAKASTSASPRPSASRSASTPGGVSVTHPVVQPSLPGSSSPDPTTAPSSSAPSEPSPSPSPTAGTGTVADAPSSPSPVAQGPAAPSEQAPAPSTTPEHIV
ncbi:hypothetical protein ABTY96_43780 [Streptomyces sp. NPDC096057]|uniref:hypothetical protein n=1 Tax=Streptomyces sp. NPDC096057 TaxID=3155543 RepID=UPI003323B40F